MKKRITQDDYIKANRKASREEEIESHGHPVSYNRVHQSKKVYNRQKRKAEDKALPFFVLGSSRSFQKKEATDVDRYICDFLQLQILSYYSTVDFIEA